MAKDHHACISMSIVVAHHEHTLTTYSPSCWTLAHTHVHPHDTHIAHRPLLIYFIAEALHYMSAAAMLAMGFSRTVHQGTTFYYKPRSKKLQKRGGLGHQPPQQQSQGEPQEEGDGAPQPPPPIVLLHGVGAGLISYIIVSTSSPFSVCFCHVHD